MSNSIINNFSQKVYNLCSQIPKGKVSNYKLIAVASGNASAARTVGTILRKCECKENTYKVGEDVNNYHCSVYCYRVIKSDFNVGKFIWRNGNVESRTDIKREKLVNEGLFFDKKGYIPRNLRKKVIFNDFHE